MLRRVLSFSLVLVAVGLFSASRADADEIFTWTLPASPSILPGNATPGVAFEIGAVQFWINGVSQGMGTFDFFNFGDGGGFDLFTATNPNVLNEFGGQLYSGPSGNQESSPTFLPNTYQLNHGSAAGPLETLTITVGPNGDLFTYDVSTVVSGVPEPGSLLLLGSGALGLLGFARRKIFS